MLDPNLHAKPRNRIPTEEEAHTTDLRECVDKSSSQRADSEGQSRSWEEPPRAHLFAQDIQRNLENDVRDIEDTEDCVVVCEVVSIALHLLGDLEGIP